MEHRVLNILTTLAAVLHLGNVKFEEVGEKEVGDTGARDAGAEAGGRPSNN